MAGSRETDPRQACDINAVREKGAHGECLRSLVAKGEDVPTCYVGALLSPEDGAGTEGCVTCSVVPMEACGSSLPGDAVEFVA